MTGPSVRSTRQRAAISTLLETVDDFRSAQELHDELRRRGENIGLTTVYRTLQSMAAAGVVDTLRTDTGESVYRAGARNIITTIWCAVVAAPPSRWPTTKWRPGPRKWLPGMGFPTSATPSKSSATAQTAGPEIRAALPHRNRQHSEVLLELFCAAVGVSEPRQSTRRVPGRRCQAPAGSRCAARRRSARRRESCTAA